MNDFKAFDVLEVPLQGKNLIEASAGTGKTYSIGILVLRLILEKKLSVQEILMVTFTKAAVAELEERVRLFLRSAYKVARHEAIGDQLITALVQRAIKEQGHPAVVETLRQAVLLLDETAVQTIHSFCEKTLAEFAFETSQLFKSEILEDTSALLEEQLNIFWRQEVTTLPAPLLRRLGAGGMTRESLLKVLKTHLGGKAYLHYQKDKDYSFCQSDHETLLSLVSRFDEEEAYLRGCFVDHVHANKVKIAGTTSNHNVKTQLLIHLDKPVDLLKVIVEKKDLGYVKSHFPDLIEKALDCEQVRLQQENVVNEFKNKLNCLAISQITSGFEESKRRLNLLSFDDMITGLHKALLPMEGDQDQGSAELRNFQQERLKCALRQKYNAVFIDEFQDTDRMQFEIFFQLFQADNILFYIADPKQSIYSFRKADIFTYFQALTTVDTRYSMNVNYRSSDIFIEGLNALFAPYPGFDAFFFEGSAHSINYVPVVSPLENSKGFLVKDREKASPLYILSEPKKDQIASSVAALTVELLEGKRYFIEKDGLRVKIKPSDIGVLVRTHGEARSVRTALASFAIPAVTIDDSKVLQSEEARLLIYLLEAMHEINVPAIKKALFTPLTGYDVANILALDTEHAVSDFRTYKRTWETNGLYAAIMEFVQDYSVTKILYSDTLLNSERIISNFFQLIELAHQVQSQKELSAPEIISWLKRGYEGLLLEGDEFVQRIENDEEAVKIVTIHTSKGLEYPIVLAPFLDFQEDTNSDAFRSFRDDENGEYFFIEKKQGTGDHQALHVRQNEQENRRLFYVAITRAVYACFIFRNSYFLNRNTTLNTFLDAQKIAPSKLVATLASPDDKTGYRYFPKTPKTEVHPVQQAPFTLLGNNWTKLSFTLLAEKHHAGVKLRKTPGLTSDYDRFIFHELTWGIETGNMMHYIVEHVHFNDPKTYAAAIGEAVKQYRLKAGHSAMLELMLDHVVNARIKTVASSFSLAQLDQDKCLNEFEFDFEVDLFDPAVLAKISGEEVRLNQRFKSDLEGLMNGKIDLFFEHDGQFFILDWKSNYLGDSLAAYDELSVGSAMTDSNYHLQYLIYSVAAKKYLESRVPGFDYSLQFGGVIYLFIRGIRKDHTNGIFQTKPPLEKILALEHLLKKKTLHL